MHPMDSNICLMMGLTIPLTVMIVEPSLVILFSLETFMNQEETS